MDRGGALSPLLFPAPPCHLGIINSCGAGGQIRAISHLGRPDKTQTLSVTLHDICFSFHLRLREEKSTCFISSMGATQDPLPAESVPPFDTDGAQVTDCAPMHRRGMGHCWRCFHHFIRGWGAIRQLCCSQGLEIA